MIGTIILSPHTKFGVIIITIAHLMLDFVSYKYKGNIYTVKNRFSGLLEISSVELRQSILSSANLNIRVYFIS